MSPDLPTVSTRGGVEDTRLEAKAKDTKKFRGQGQTLLRPRTTDTGASVLQKKESFQKFFSSNLKKRSSKIFFPAKKVFESFSFRQFLLEENKKRSSQIFCRFLALSSKISTVRKILLFLSRGQGNFEGLEASRPRPRTSKCVLEDVLGLEDVLEDSTSGFYCLNNYCYLLMLIHFTKILTLPFQILAVLVTKRNTNQIKQSFYFGFSTK